MRYGYTLYKLHVIKIFSDKMQKLLTFCCICGKKQLDFIIDFKLE